MSSGFLKTKPLSQPCLSLCQLARAFILWQSSFSTLESYTSFTTQNHPMKRYNWSVWWEEACRMCDADAPRLCHHAFLHTTALMSGPLPQMKKKTCLPGRMSSGFLKTKPLSRPCLSLCQLARAFILWQSSFSTLESYTSFTTQNHPMKRYNWSVWWESALHV